MHDTRNEYENASPADGDKRSRLTERPERRGQGRGRRVTVLLFVCGSCLVVLAGVGVLVWQLSSHTSPTVVYNSTPTSTGSSAKAGQLPTGCTGAREPAAIIQQQTALGLHLSVAQVQQRVLAGKTVAQIATEQGLTAAQLHDVELQALHVADAQWLSMGCITQQDVQDNMQRDTGTPAYMDEEFTDWFKA